MSFYIGQRVLCIAGNDSLLPDYKGKTAKWPDAIVKGHVYTIRDVDTRLASRGCPMALRFEEYHHPLKANGWETPFPSDGFRPLDENRIDVFRQMLVTKHKEEPSPVVTSDHEVPA